MSAEIIESDAMNAALLASHNPAEALRRIRYLVDEARDQHRIGDRSKVMVALNKIAALTGQVNPISVQNEPCAAVIARERRCQT
jgi:hypothetical protein